MSEEYDREELTRITHQHLRKVSDVVDLGGGPKITQQNLRTLKTVALEEDKGKVRARRMIDDINNALRTLFSNIPGLTHTQHTQCKEYGHRGAVKAMCTDCGKRITSSKEVRGCMPKVQRKTTDAEIRKKIFWNEDGSAD